MGTNFYFFTRRKETAQRMGPKAELVDEPEFGYELHIAKTSVGWKPLFEAHKNIYSVRDLHKFYYDTIKRDDTLTIRDEYGQLYTWPEFEKRVIQYGTPKRWSEDGHYYGGNWRCEADNDCERPWNHWEGEYADPEGYRFQETVFY